LRGRRRLRRASTISAYKVLGADGSLRAKSDRGRAWACPIRFSENIDLLREPATVVLVLEDLRRILATSKDHGATSERKAKRGATTQRQTPNKLSTCPLERILRHHNGSPQASVGHRVTKCRPLTDRALAYWTVPTARFNAFSPTGLARPSASRSPQSPWP
jgi:hypothetical protein